MFMCMKSVFHSCLSICDTDIWFSIHVHYWPMIWECLSLFLPVHRHVSPSVSTLLDLFKTNFETNLPFQHFKNFDPSICNQGCLTRSVDSNSCRHWPRARHRSYWWSGFATQNNNKLSMRGWAQDCLSSYFNVACSLTSVCRPNYRDHASFTW